MFSAFDYMEAGTFSGKGKIWFSSPPAEVSGQGAVEISPHGGTRLTLEIEEYSIPYEYKGFLTPFFLGVPPQEEGSEVKLGEQESPIVSRIEFLVEKGVFKANQAVISNHGFQFSREESVRIEMMPSDLVFAPNEAKSEYFWCLPLFGQLEKYRQCQTAFRIADRGPYISFYADGHHYGLVIFETCQDAHDAPAALLYSEIGDRPHSDTDEVTTLLPWGLIAALNFACGTDVSAAGPDLRDSGGALSRRFHLRFGESQQRDGFPAFSRIDSTKPGSGIGAFLQSFFQLSQDDRRSLTPILNLIHHGAPGSASVDENIASLVKALDALCKRHRLSRSNLSKALTTPNSDAIAEVLIQAKEKLKAVRRGCKDRGELDQLAPIDKIISRHANVDTDDLDFGIAVTALLGKAGLHDHEAMNRHYSQIPNDQTWEGMLSSTRGEVIHAGAIPIESRHEVVSWFELSRHLHDICKRIILWEVAYTGTYMPSNVTYIGPYPQHRIAADSTLSQLGYTAPLPTVK